MPVKLKPLSEIKIRLGIDKNGSIQKFYQNTCYKMMDQFVPYKDGNLRTTTDLSNPEYIVYQMPYARYQYYGEREDGTRVVKKYTTPGTGPYWDKRMWALKKDELIGTVQREINRRSKS